MKKSTLKIMSYLIINESTNDEIERNELFKLLKNSNKNELIDFINENRYILNELILPKTQTTMSVVGMGVSGRMPHKGLPVWLFYKMVRSFFDKCMKRCGIFDINSIRRQVCIVRCRIDKYEKLLNIAQQNEQSSSKINNLQKKVNKFRKKLIDYQRFGERRGTSY